MQPVDCFRPCSGVADIDCIQSDSRSICIHASGMILGSLEPRILFNPTTYVLVSLGVSPALLKSLLLDTVKSPSRAKRLDTWIKAFVPSVQTLL